VPPLFFSCTYNMSQHQGVLGALQRLKDGFAAIPTTLEAAMRLRKAAFDLANIVIDEEALRGVADQPSLQRCALGWAAAVGTASPPLSSARPAPQLPHPVHTAVHHSLPPLPLSVCRNVVAPRQAAG
jgi:hypothetical protein